MTAFPTVDRPRAVEGGRGGGARRTGGSGISLGRWGGPARIAIGTIVVIGALFLFVFPSQAFLAQQRELGDARRDVTVLREQNERLADEADRLRDPAEIERIARERFGLVMPGEEAFAVVPAPGGARPSDGAGGDAEGAP